VPVVEDLCLSDNSDEGADDNRTNSDSDIDQLSEITTDEIDQEEPVQGAPPHIRRGSLTALHPDVVRLVESLDSPYCHSTSERDIQEMHGAQIYHDGGASLCSVSISSHILYSENESF
jgi:hypothetical protein